jgi:hypothetical protein
LVEVLGAQEAAIDELYLQEMLNASGDHAGEDEPRPEDLLFQP